ncbi:MAG: hypothetical protein JO301_12980, partial [Chitinophagaceae bacterium]|nr:hypothetical protein [Chitinophagaceae bacterium]
MLPGIKGAENTSKGDIRRVDSLNDLAFREKRYDVPQALNNLAVAQNIATAINYQKGLGTSYLYEAGIFYQNGYQKKALSTYFKALQLFKTLKDTFNIAFASQQIALSMQMDGRTQEAMQLYNESLRVFMMLGKQEDIVNVKNAMGVLGIRMKRYKEAEKQLVEALVIAQRIRYTYGEKKVY